MYSLQLMAGQLLAQTPLLLLHTFFWSEPNAFHWISMLLLLSGQQIKYRYLHILAKTKQMKMKTKTGFSKKKTSHSIQYFFSIFIPLCKKKLKLVFEDQHGLDLFISQTAYSNIKNCKVSWKRNQPRWKVSPSVNQSQWNGKEKQKKAKSSHISNLKIVLRCVTRFDWLNDN